MNKQSRLMSMLETTLSTAIGFIISLLAQMAVLPLLGVQVTPAQNISFALIMTAVSLARQFAMRRLFEALHIRKPMTPAALAVLAERHRQIDGEGWSIEHDDDHPPGELGIAGACYALKAPDWVKHPMSSVSHPPPAPGQWPWSLDWWKPRDFRRDMVRAGALILAEIERFDRARKRARP